MNNTELFKAVIDRHKISSPLSEETRGAIYKKKKGILKNILRKEGLSILFSSMAVSIFLWIKRYGITISLNKIIIAIPCAFVISISAIAITSVYIAKNVSATRNEITQENKTEIKQNIQKADSVKIGIEKKPIAGASVLHYNFAVLPVEMDGVSSETINELTIGLIQELRNIKADLMAIAVSELDAGHVSDKILSVSIIKLRNQKKSPEDKEEAYRISAKVIDNQNSVVLLFLSETAQNEGEIKNTIKILAGKISGN